MKKLVSLLLAVILALGVFGVGASALSITDRVEYAAMLLLTGEDRPSAFRQGQSQAAFVAAADAAFDAINFSRVIILAEQAFEPQALVAVQLRMWRDRFTPAAASGPSSMRFELFVINGNAVGAITELERAGDWEEAVRLHNEAIAEKLALFAQYNVTPPLNPFEGWTSLSDVGTIFGTNWPATTINWIMFFLLFGWIWMWF